MQKADTCTIQDIAGFYEVKLKVKYLESCENCKIWLSRKGYLIGGLTPRAIIGININTFISLFHN